MHRVANFFIIGCPNLKKTYKCFLFHQALSFSFLRVFPSSTFKTNDKILSLISSHLPDLLPLSAASLSILLGLYLCVTAPNHAKRGWRRLISPFGDCWMHSYNGKAYCDCVFPSNALSSDLLRNFNNGW